MPDYLSDLKSSTQTTTTISPPFGSFLNDTNGVSFASLTQHFNVILDSGCTVHIIHDHCFFWTYDRSQAMPVGTANCGILNTLAKGEVRFEALVGGSKVIF